MTDATTPAALAPVTLARLERDAQERATALKYAGVALEEARIAVYCTEKALRELNIASGPRAQGRRMWSHQQMTHSRLAIRRHRKARLAGRRVGSSSQMQRRVDRSCVRGGPPP